MFAALQGSWTMEGEMLKGVFIRKDNGKQLTTTRIVAGDELIQVNTTANNTECRIPAVNVHIRRRKCRKFMTVLQIKQTTLWSSFLRATTTKAWTQRGFLRGIRPKAEPGIAELGLRGPLLLPVQSAQQFFIPAVIKPFVKMWPFIFWLFL